MCQWLFLRICKKCSKKIQTKRDFRVAVENLSESVYFPGLARCKKGNRDFKLFHLNFSHPASLGRFHVINTLL